MLYGCMMGAYDGLYLPMMVLGYVFSVPFFLLSVRTSQKKGQKASLTKYVSVALVCYISVFVLLALWGRSDAFHLSLMGENGLSINLYTVLFILFFGIGYGAYYATADMPIPMVADCSDYETYRSGKYIPRHHGYAVQPWWISWFPACRYGRRHCRDLHRPEQPAHPV